VIDLGPEGGVNGGGVVAEAVPERLVVLDDSHTGAALRSVLARTAADAPVLVAA
jgi:excinuclease ABC subunit A